MGFVTWATNFVFMFWNGIGGWAALDVIGKHVFNLFDDLGKALNMLGK
jgi:hypothetical protein